MCIAFWLLDKHPAYWLILALNRDEILARPTLPAHFWNEEEQHQDEAGARARARAGAGGHILAGRDVLGGGTWMGITTGGKFAFITNVRERLSDGSERNPKDPSSRRPFDEPERTSRGTLPLRFFNSRKTPVDYLHEIAAEAEKYNGFNLVVADAKRGEMALLSNRHVEGGAGGEDEAGGTKASVLKVPPGINSLSNGTLDSKWHKMERGKRLFSELMLPLPVEEKVNGHQVAAQQHIDIPVEKIMETVLRDQAKATDVSAQLADTCCSEDLERSLSSIFVDTKLWNNAYGTRSMAVVGIGRDGRISLFEKYLEDGVWKDHSFQFRMDP